MDHAALGGAGQGVGVSSFEAALNLLREQRRAVKDVRWAIINDHELARTDAGHRSDLLAQTLAEQGQLTAAIDLLEEVEAGTLVVVDAALSPGPAARGEPPPRPARAHGLIKRFRPEGQA